MAHAAYQKFGKDIFEPNRNLELAEFGKAIALNIIKKDLADAGIFIESWASEKSYYDKPDQTLQRLEKVEKSTKKMANHLK